MSTIHRIRSQGASLLIALVAWFVIGTGGAYGGDGFQKQMEDTFNAMASTTNPQIMRGSTRGVITGGSFTVRHKVTQLDQLMALRLPSINIGCGGWDVFGGSFSVISSDQVIAMLRAIAASAVAYAFKLALCTISDKVCQQMELLWKDNMFANLMGKSSCELGQALVDNTVGAFKTRANQAAANQAVATGVKDDSADGTNNMKADSPAVEGAKRNENNPEALRAIIKGNHLWNALKAHGDANWSAFGGKAFMEDVMSVAGTIIMCAPGISGCPTTGGVAVVGQEDVVILARDPIMKLTHLVKGNQDNSKLRRWQCDNATHCLNPSEETITNFEGMEKRLRRALLGETEAMGQGLIGRYAVLGNKAGGDDWLISAGGHYVAMAFSLANGSELDARYYIEEFIEIMAAEITYRVVNEALVQVAAATSLYEGGGAVEAQKMVRDAQRDLAVELDTFKQRASEKGEHLRYFAQLSAMQPKFRLPTIVVPERR